MSFTLKFCLLQRYLTRLLQTTGLSLALMTASAAAVRAADANDTDIEIGADGATGFGDGFGDIPAGPGQPATANAAASSATGNATATATAKGGNGGSSIGENDDSPGGDASASSTAITTGSGDALSSANATGGTFGEGGFGSIFATGGSAMATADGSATGGGRAIATAVATTGKSDFGVNPVPAANASSSAETEQGAMAQALSTINSLGELAGTATSTAKTSFGGVSVQSDATNTNFSEFGTVEAIAQGGSGQTFVDPTTMIYAFSTAVPDKAYATTLIDGASNVADALLGPDDKIFGTAILGFDGSSTFDFSFRGDLLLGVINGGADIIVNGTEISTADGFAENTVFDLGSFGPNIELTIIGNGTFAIGGAVPEPSTWAMMLLGFAASALSAIGRIAASTFA
jgi:hypothetical protein